MKAAVCELCHELSNILTQKIVGSLEIIGKT